MIGSNFEDWFEVFWSYDFKLELRPTGTTFTGGRVNGAAIYLASALILANLIGFIDIIEFNPGLKLNLFDRWDCLIYLIIPEGTGTTSGGVVFGIF